MPQAGHTFAHLFCEMEGREIQTITKEKNRGFQKECGGVKQKLKNDLKWWGECQEANM